MLAVGLLAIAACSSPAVESVIPLQPGEVRLLTQGGGGIGCAANVIEGDLVAHDDAGTAIVEAGVTLPIRWPFGYTARRQGAEVEVLDEAENVVAVTGTRVSMGGGETTTGTWSACPGPTILVE